MDRKELGQARDRLGLTVEGLGRAMNPIKPVPPSTLWRWLSGSTAVPNWASARVEDLLREARIRERFGERPRHPPIPAPAFRLTHLQVRAARGDMTYPEFAALLAPERPPRAHTIARWESGTTPVPRWASRRIRELLEHGDPPEKDRKPLF